MDLEKLSLTNLILLKLLQDELKSRDIDETNELNQNKEAQKVISKFYK